MLNIVRFFVFASLSGPFKKAWLELVGTPYTNHPIAMSEEELNRLPTILLQFKGHSSNKDVLETVDNKQHLPLAATLDPNNPLDVLVAVPPSHYMEYQSAKGMYVPGIYFEEADGSVLGANVMMLHDILFDVEGFRIGWVESHCNYAKLVAPYMSLSKATTFVAATAKKISTTGSASFNSPKLRAHSGTLRDNVNSAGYCSSLKCRISIGSILFIWSFLTASMWVRKRRRVRTNRSGTTSQLQAMADIAATNSSFRLTTISDDESSAISVRGGKNFTRTSVLRSRSHLPTCVSDSDDDMQLPVRGKRRTREAVLRSRSSQNII